MHGRVYETLEILKALGLLKFDEGQSDDKRAYVMRPDRADGYMKIAVAAATDKASSS
jgi:hypothetical protein